MGAFVWTSFFAFVLGFFLSHPALADEEFTCSGLTQGVLGKRSGLAGHQQTLVEELANRIESSLSPELAEVFRIAYSDPQPGGFVSPDRRDFENARLEVATEPKGSFARVVRNLSFGYPKGRSIGSGYLNYIAYDAGGKVVAVGGGSPEVLEVFKTHLRGRQLTVAQRNAVKRANRKIFQALRSDPDAVATLREFARSRGWPEEIPQKNRLVFYPSRFDLEAWARKNHVSRRDLILAGWIGVDFDKSGRPRYFPKVRNSVLIPFFDESGVDIVSWRIRKMDPGTGPKYLSWPMDRSYDDHELESESLYNNWKLSTVSGKKILITEGEFKCMVAEMSLGLVTLGLPGISQFNRKMAQRIRDANPSEVIVILDRDPRGKGYFNADGITDSQRAAYEIAAMLEREGVKASIGQVPDAFSGSKAGIDDVILKVPNGRALIQQSIDGAVKKEVYARRLEISEPLMYLKYLKRRLTNVLDDAMVNGRRGAHQSPSQMDLELAVRLLIEIKVLYENQFESHFPGRKVFQSTWYRARQLFTKGRLAFESGEKGLQIVPALDEMAWLDFSGRCHERPNSDAQAACEAQQVRADFPDDEYEVFKNATADGLLIPYLVIKRESGKAAAVITFDRMQETHFAGGTIPSVRRSRVSGSPEN